MPGPTRTLAVLLFLSIALGALFAVRWRQAELRVDQTLAWAHAALDSAGKAPPPSTLRASELEELEKRSGLSDPVSALRDSLIAHPELIPYPGVSGGRMGFYDRDGIVLLPGGYVFAPFEDGHVGGQMLVRFDLPRPGSIHWQRLWAAME